jgi:hypothetical protein
MMHSVVVSLCDYNEFVFYVSNLYLHFKEDKPNKRAKTGSMRKGVKYFGEGAFHIVSDSFFNIATYLFIKVIHNNVPS